MQTMLLEEFYQGHKELNSWHWVMDLIKTLQTRNYTVMRRYVDGDQDILRKPEEMGKPNNKIVLNFARKIIDLGRRTSLATRSATWPTKTGKRLKNTLRSCRQSWSTTTRRA